MYKRDNKSSVSIIAFKHTGIFKSKAYACKLVKISSSSEK